MTQKLSIVISTLDRARLFNTMLFALCRWQTYDPKQVELVVVIDRPAQFGDFLNVMRNYARYFYKSTLIQIDSKGRFPRMVSPSGNPSLGVNIGVQRAENEIILKTDAECLPITQTVSESLNRFKRDELLFSSVRFLTPSETELFQNGSLEGLHPHAIFGRQMSQMRDLWCISEAAGKRYGYWFGAVFSREMFMQVGGVDEEFMGGFAGEDDEWAERMGRNGVQWRWSDTSKLLHQYHGENSQKWRGSRYHQKNIARLQWSRDQGIRKANVGTDWGGSYAIENEETF